MARTREVTRAAAAAGVGGMRMSAVGRPFRLARSMVKNRWWRRWRCRRLMSPRGTRTAKTIARPGAPGAGAGAAEEDGAGAAKTMAVVSGSGMRLPTASKSSRPVVAEPARMGSLISRNPRQLPNLRGRNRSLSSRSRRWPLPVPKSRPQVCRLLPATARCPSGRPPPWMRQAHQPKSQRRPTKHRRMSLRVCRRD